MIAVSYGTLDLQSGGICVTDTDVDSPPKNRVQAEGLAEADGSVIVKESYESKTFKVEGYLKATSISGLDSLLDTFKTALNVKPADFDIDHAGSTRRFVATPQNLTISRPRGLNTATFTVEFFCASP